MKKQIATKNAPEAIGPYSQGVKVGNMVFVSGQIPLNPKTGEFAGEDIASQTAQCMTNIKGVLAKAGLNLDDIAKTTVFLSDMNNFAGMNTVYAEYFSAPYPARATVEVARLPKDALVEIEAIAFIK